MTTMRIMMVAAILILLAGCAGMAPTTGKRELMIVGIDEKVSVINGDFVLGPPGKDSVAIIDIGSDPLAPRLIANLPLMNSIFGPPTNLAITADNGAGGRSDGNVDTVSVIDLEANPPRVIDKVVVGDAPEGFAISPTGKLAVAVLLSGNDAPTNSPFYSRNGKVVALKIDGKKVTRSNDVEVRGLPEGVVFSNDGRYIYVGNYIDRDISILRVDGDQIVNTGTTFRLPGQPASMRGRTR